MNLEPEIFEFLKKLKKNNNRPWFKDNKSTFDTHNSNVKKYFSNFLTIIKTNLNGNLLKFLEFIKMFVFRKIKHRIKPILQ